MFEKIKEILMNKNINKQTEKMTSGNKNYEDELLERYGKNDNNEINHINILIITDTHNCLYCDKESIEKIKNAEYDVCLI